MQSDLLSSGWVRSRASVWVILFAVIAVSAVTGCNDSSSIDEEERGQDTASADTRAIDSGTSRSDTDAVTHAEVSGDAPADAPDRDTCEGMGCGCARTLSGGVVAYEICEGAAVCCDHAIDGVFLGCADVTSTQHCGACGNACGDGEACVDGACTCGAQSNDAGAVCVTGEACCSVAGFEACRAADACTCGESRCDDDALCCWSQALGALSCIDPIRDNNNCGGCGLEAGSITENPQFLCGVGEWCDRNYSYSLARAPEEQNANGIYIGECRGDCGVPNRVFCPGGVDPETNLLYTRDMQSCTDPLSSNEFCGVIMKVGWLPTTTGQCSEHDPQTFGELKSFAGVRCGSGETCRAKRRCDNPAPFPGTDSLGDPCSPRTHYYYDVAENPDEFPDGEFIPTTPIDSIFTPDDVTRDLYVQNLYLRAVCDTTCRAGMLRCVNDAGAFVCIDPNTDSTFCGAPLTENCEDNTSTGGADGDGIDCNADLPNTLSAQCAGGLCADLACAPNFANCDGDPSSGCEVDLNAPNNTHCGACSSDAAGAPIPSSAYSCANVNGGNSACGGADPASLRCAYCGDSRYDGALNSARVEGCDDGNSVNGDGCSTTCQIEFAFSCTAVLGAPSQCVGGHCGNGVLTPDEQCDPAPAGSLPTATCNADCTFSACGDGKRNPNAGANEACDDGNTSASDGCSPTCQFESGFTCAGPANGLSVCTR